MTFNPVISVRDLTVRAGGKTILDGVNFDVEPGKLTVLIGPNGAGKSTLLGALTGDVSPESGSIHFLEKPLASWRLKDLAKVRAVMLQENQVFFPFTIEQVVAMGRVPWQAESNDEEDELLISSSIKTVELHEISGQAIGTLSGGERSRTSFARVLAQNTALLMLDEPTAALDLKHQESLLRVVQDFTRGGGTALLVLHDLNLAGHYADRIALLHGGTVMSYGTPRKVLTAEAVHTAYGQHVELLEHPSTGGFLVVPVR